MNLFAAGIDDGVDDPADDENCWSSDVAAATAAAFGDERADPQKQSKNSSAHLHPPPPTTSASASRESPEKTRSPFFGGDRHRPQQQLLLLQRNGSAQKRENTEGQRSPLADLSWGADLSLGLGSDDDDDENGDENEKKSFGRDIAKAAADPIAMLAANSKTSRTHTRIESDGDGTVQESDGLGGAAAGGVGSDGRTTGRGASAVAPSAVIRDGSADATDAMDAMDASDTDISSSRQWKDASGVAAAGESSRKKSWSVSLDGMVDDGDIKEDGSNKKEGEQILNNKGLKNREESDGYSVEYMDDKDDNIDDDDDDDDEDDDAFWSSFAARTALKSKRGTKSNTKIKSKSKSKVKSKANVGGDKSKTKSKSKKDQKSGKSNVSTARSKNIVSNIDAVTSKLSSKRKRVDHDDDDGTSLSSVSSTSSSDSSSVSSTSSSSSSSSSSSDDDDDSLQLKNKSNDKILGRRRRRQSSNASSSFSSSFSSSTAAAAATTTQGRLDVRRRTTQRTDENFAALTTSSKKKESSPWNREEKVESYSSDDDDDDGKLESPRWIDLGLDSGRDDGGGGGGGVGIGTGNRLRGGRGRGIDAVDGDEDRTKGSNARTAGAKAIDLCNDDDDDVDSGMEEPTYQNPSTRFDSDPFDCLVGIVNEGSTQERDAAVPARNRDSSTDGLLSSSSENFSDNLSSAPTKEDAGDSHNGINKSTAPTEAKGDIAKSGRAGRKMPENPYRPQTQKKAPAKENTGSSKVSLEQMMKDLDESDSDNDDNESKSEDFSSDLTLQHAEKPVEKIPLVHHSLYKPPPYRPRPQPRVHQLTARSRPPHMRQMLPVAQVFRPPVSNLWRSKFHSFNHLQSEVAQVLVNSDDNIVVSAPTGAGKTAVFEMAMGRLFSSDLRGRPAGHGISKSRKVVYISPSKALCEERNDDWSKRLADIDPTIECACVTGDATRDAYRDIATAHVIITTPEKWDGITRRWTDNVFLIGSVKLLLIDEVHLLGDDSRGCTLEAVISRMKTVQRATKAKANLSSSDMEQATYANTTEEALKSDMRIVTVSATLPNVADIANFVDANEAYAFDSSYRPVPLRIEVVGQGYMGGNQYMFDQAMIKRVPEILREFDDGRPSIVFCHTKKDTETVALAIADLYGVSPQANPQLRDLANQTRLAKLQRCLMRGIAYHNASLDASDRKLVEQAFSSGMIRSLCATSTLAMGVNLPARLVVIKGTSVWRGTGIGHQEIDPGTLLQMIGRAGRPGFDTNGTAVIMTDNKSKKRYQQLSMGLETVESRLLGKLVETINTEVSQKVITDASQALDWLKGTFFFSRIKKNPVYYGMQGKTETQQDAYLQKKCLDSLEELHRSKIIELQSDGMGLKPLPGSHVMSRNMVAFEAMKSIVALPHDAGPLQLLQMLSNVEGLQKPLRRNEKRLLNDAHKLIKYKLEGPPSKVRVKTPAEKAFVMLQCGIGQIYLEDPTLRQEMSHMVEYAERMIGACEQYHIDGSRHGHVALESMLLWRSLAYSLWGAGDGVLNQISGIGKKSVTRMELVGIRNFADVTTKSSNEIEQACGRRSPFGQEIKVCVQKILDQVLCLSAHIQGLDDPSQPTSLVVRLDEMVDESNRQYDRSAAILSYTLAVHTDRPGGLLMNRQRIYKPGEHRITCPDRFGRIYVRLVANLVGLDSRLDLDGNDQIVTSSFNLSPKGTKGKKSKAATNKASRSSGVGSQPKKKKAKTQNGGDKTILQELVKGVDDHRMSTKKKPAMSTSKRITNQETSSIRNNTSQQRRPSVEKTSPRPTKSEVVDLCQDNGGDAFDGTFVSPSPPPSTRNMPSTHSTPGSMNSTRRATAATERMASKQPGNKSFMNWREQKRRRESGGKLNASTNGIDGVDQGVSASTANNIGNTASWRYEKKEQEALQKRAFGSPKENPFDLFKFDPNNAEKNLEAFSHSSTTRTIDDGRSSNHRFGLGLLTSRFKSKKERGRGKSNAPKLPPRELLRMKANEQQNLANMQTALAPWQMRSQMSTNEPSIFPSSVQATFSQNYEQYQQLLQQQQLYLSPNYGTTLAQQQHLHHHQQQQMYQSHYQHQQQMPMMQMPMHHDQYNSRQADHFSGGSQDCFTGLAEPEGDLSSPFFGADAAESLHHGQADQQVGGSSHDFLGGGTTTTTTGFAEPEGNSSTFSGTNGAESLHLHHHSTDNHNGTNVEADMPQYSTSTEEQGDSSFEAAFGF